MNFKTLFSSLILLSFLSCKKSSSSADPDKFIVTSENSTWNYQQTNSAGPTPVVTTYTITSTNRDSVINSRSYHVYTNTGGGNRYNNITGSDYYQFDSLSGGLSAGIIERLYLKDDAAVNISWSQNISLSMPGIPIPIPVTITNTIAEKGISRTINSIVYSDVVRVSTTITSSVIPSASLTSSIQNYYARKYGLIEGSTLVSLNYLGFVQNVNLQVKLLSATLN